MALQSKYLEGLESLAHGSLVTSCCGMCLAGVEKAMKGSIKDLESAVARLRSGPRPLRRWEDPQLPSLAEEIESLKTKIRQYKVSSVARREPVVRPTCPMVAVSNAIQKS